MNPEDDDTSVDTGSEASGSLELKNVSKQKVARKAFNQNDPEVSRYIHDVSKQASERHQGYVLIC